MKKILIILTILVMLSSIVLADDTCYDKIYSIADKLKQNSTLLTTATIDDFVEGRTTFKFFWNPRTTCTFFTEAIGDCTDKARLKTLMLDHLGIETRLVHGYAEYDNIKSKHDWYEFKYNNEWYYLKKINDGNLKKIGGGVW